MKLIYIIIFAFTLNFAAAQDFWEEIDLPSNRPVLDLYQDDEGTYYSAGIGSFKTTDFENWEGINYFHVETDEFELEGRLDGLNNGFHSIMKFQESVLVGLMGDGNAFISTNNGEAWDVIENIKSAGYITKYNEDPFIVSHDGVFTFHFGEYTFENLTDKLTSHRIEVVGRVNNTLHINIDFNDREMVYFFDLESEEITDSVNKTELDIEGEYLETEDHAYIVKNNILYVNDKQIRSADHLNLVSHDLKQILEADFYSFNYRVLENGEIFLNNWTGGYIIASPGFEDYEVYDSPHASYNRVFDVKIIDDEYYLCTSYGLFRTNNKDFEDLDFLSGNMGSGIYHYINFNESSGEYHLINKGVLSVYDGVDKSMKSVRGGYGTIATQWDDKILYREENSFFISDDFGESWSEVVISNSKVNKMFILDNKDIALRAGQQIAYIDNESYEVSYKPQPSYDNSFTIEFHIVDTGEYLYIFADDGLYQSHDGGSSWERIKEFNFSEELGKYVITNSGRIINIGDVFVALSRQGVLYSNDLGENWIDLEYGTAAGSEMEYFISDGQIFITGNYQNAANTTRLTVNANNEVEVEDVSEGVDNLAQGFFTKGDDGRLYVSFRHGNFRTNGPLSSVEELPELPGQENQIAIYPNVSSDFITVNLNASSSKPKVYRITGKAIDCPLDKLSNNSYKVDIRKLDKGMYVIVDESSEKPEGSFFFRE